MNANYRLFAVRGRSGPIGRSFGRYPDLETALHNKAFFESNGYNLKVQQMLGGRWMDVEAVQSKLSP